MTDAAFDRKNMQRSVPADGDGGFTLLEMLVVVAILGMLIGLVAPAVLRKLGGARVSIAIQSIARLSSVLDIYRLDAGGYPTTEQGLSVLVVRPSTALNWNGPYLKGDVIPLDAWGHPYIYRSPSIRPSMDYDLCSRGPNNQAVDTASDLICNKPNS
jgi:general secretion pathway protein G